MEKAIHAKIGESQVFQTGGYQAGFKAGVSCGTD